MSVFKIFPEKDATIYSEFPTQNTGISEILDVSKNVSLNFPSFSAVGRSLIRFSDTDMSSSVAKYVCSAPFTAHLRVYLADASVIPLTYNLEAYAISGAWDMGTGRIDDIPIVTNGVCWQNSKASPSSLWPVSFSAGSTGSFFTGNLGGGAWYTGSKVTQSFNYRSLLDINFDVTSIINQFVSGTLHNDGIIIKNDSFVEFDPNYVYKLTYFSIDTNTIYPPCLELKWDDSVFTPDTGSMSQVSSQDIVVSLGNNQGKYEQDSVQRFDVNVRDRYPQRTFVTSSLFTVGKYLPSGSSTYRVIDLDTNNVIIDFDDNYTKVSTDANGNFFNLYMNGLEPERYYKVQIKTTIGKNSIVFDKDYYFKVIK